jgi:hypothetical protein
MKIFGPDDEPLTTVTLKWTEADRVGLRALGER